MHKVDCIALGDYVPTGLMADEPTGLHDPVRPTGQLARVVEEDVLLGGVVLLADVLLV